jgi:hypothetical protein
MDEIIHYRNEILAKDVPHNYMAYGQMQICSNSGETRGLWVAAATPEK